MSRKKNLFRRQILVINDKSFRPSIKPIIRIKGNFFANATNHAPLLHTSNDERVIKHPNYNQFLLMAYNILFKECHCVKNGTCSQSRQWEWKRERDGKRTRKMDTQRERENGMRDRALGSVVSFIVTKQVRASSLMASFHATTLWWYRTQFFTINHTRWTGPVFLHAITFFRHFSKSAIICYAMK